LQRRAKYALIGGGSLLALGLGWGLYLLVLAGQVASLDYHSEATCTRVEGVIGAEDIVRTTAAPGLLVASDDRRATARGQPVRGAIHYVPLEPGGEIVDVTGGVPEQFHPHGISVVIGSDGRERLFVVNHPTSSPFGSDDGLHTIEVYTVLPAGTPGAPPQLVHERTITDGALISPNDVAAVDETRFYVTNDHGASSKLGHKLEEYAHLARGSVVYWDGQGFTRVAEDIHYANGIALGERGETLYVAAVTGGKILVFDRDAQTGALTWRDELLIQGPDNLTIADDGSIWVAGHPKLLTFSAHAKDPNTRSPSYVTRLSPGSNGTWTTTQLLLSDGSDLSGSTVAVPIGDDRFVVGSVFEAWILDCRLNQNQ
jgi:arylesterase/paraoxonase